MRRRAFYLPQINLTTVIIYHGFKGLYKSSYHRPGFYRVPRLVGRVIDLELIVHVSF